MKDYQIYRYSACTDPILYIYIYISNIAYRYNPYNVW